MENIRHSVFNAARRSYIGERAGNFWTLNVLLIFLLIAPVCLRAQTPPQLPPGGLIQLQVPQPAVDVSSSVTATAAFDPPVVRAGEKTFYRATIDAAESAIAWPEEISAPVELKFGPNARGQLTQFLGNRFRSLTSFVYEVRPAAPGHFTVANFSVNISGQALEIPAATLEVLTDTSAPPEAGVPRELVLQTSATNVFLGQPFRVQVVLPAGTSNQIEALREIQLNGDGLMTDKTASHESIEVVNLNGQLKPAFLREMTVTPIAAGPLKLSAQAFTAGREFTGPISIHGPVTLASGPTKYVLLVSDPVTIQVRPLPAEDQPPGFTGAIGKFFCNPPQLATNRLRVGEPVTLKVVFHGASDLARFVPPLPPRSREWQIIADQPPATGFMLIPLTDEVQATPAIPFCYFDPASAKYVDLTIPPLPVTVIGEVLPVQLPPLDDEAKSGTPLNLSGLATTPGKTVASLQPLQLRGWFVGLQLVPVLGFLGLWQWDRRRRWREAHPDIVRRRQARRALRRKIRKLQNAITYGDAAAFIQHAVEAMSIAVAPHYPANPQALVCGDVLAQLADAERNGPAGEAVKKVFAAVDARFACAPQTTADLFALKTDVQAVLSILEEKL